jgi:segregation and condensation protein B
MEKLISAIESLLFVSNKPLTMKQLIKFSGGSEADVTEALKQLSEQRANSGVVLLNAPDGYQLATNSENTEAVKSFLNADLRESLTEATVEVLAIIGYRQPISKAEIESIRGVNSQYSVRALLMRGLIEKIPNPNDARGSLYQVTTEFLQQMGITSVEELPDFNELVAKIQLPETAGLSEETAEKAAEEMDAEQATEESQQEPLEETNE